MKKVELLSPAGDYKSLYFAIHNGADAVYLGGKRFGARNYASNFDKEEMIKAIKYCHLYGVKIYVTVNTIIFDDEIEDFIKYIEFLYKNNVDAVIMQDVGMILKIRELFPDLEIHASTQMHNHNTEGINLLENLGVKRIVFARELSLEQIKNIKCNVEKEVFVYGALCVCYSGCCLFSSMNTNRSGNRGECVASCRLPYKLLKNNKEVKTNGKYILSPKELNTINYVDSLIESGVDSFKIEGRMKSPEYVGLVTKIYRKAIDSYYEYKKFYLDAKTQKDLMSLFNREFTKGYLFGDYGSSLMNINSPNHQGIHLGSIIEVNKKIIKIRLDEDINQEDGIRFIEENKGMIVNRLYNEKKLLVNQVKKGQIAIIDNKIGITKKGEVNKTINRSLIKELSLVEEKKIKIDVKIRAKKGFPLEVSFKDPSGNLVNVKGEEVEESINSPLTKKDIEKQIIKLGNTPFIVNNIDIIMDDNVFIPNSFLNEIRRKAASKLIELRENKKISNNLISLKIQDRAFEREKLNLNVLVRSEAQLKAALDSSVDNIYVTDYNLYKKYKSSNVYFSLPRVIEKYKEYKEENLLVRELGSINKYKDKNNIISDYTLNIVNKESLRLLNNLGVKRICLSPEIRINNIESSLYNTEIVIYGRIELMITKYCPLNMLINKDDKKCSLCMKNDRYSLQDEQNRIYPISHDGHLTIIYDHKNINLINDIDKIKEKANNLRIDFLEESYEEALEIINRVRRKI